MDFIIRPVYAKIQPDRNIGQEFGFGYFDSLGTFTGRLVSLAFTIAALMVVFYFIIGAFEMITSQGDKAHLVSARSKIYHSLIGFVLLIALFLIMQFLTSGLGLGLAYFNIFSIF